MVRAKKASAGVDDYHKTLGWGGTEQTVKFNGQNRRLDIADLERERGVEIKDYSSGKVYNTEDIRREVSLDKQLVDEDWEIEWVFKGCTPSSPLQTALEEAGIRVKHL